MSTNVFVFLGFWRKAEAELKKEFDSRINERKWEVYNEVTEMFGDILLSQSSSETRKDGGEQNKIITSLTLMGSDKVIRAWNDYWKFCEEAEMTGLEWTEEKHRTAQEKLMKIVVEMRNDLGYQSKVASGDLWNIFDIIAKVRRG